MRHMVRLRIETAEGTYELLSTLSDDQVLLLSDRASLEGVESGLDGDEGLQVISGRTSEQFGCWWFSKAGCTMELSCECGPVTLFEVISHVGVPERQAAVESHLAHLSELYAHFWAGEAVLNHATDELEGICSLCLIEGPEHIAALGQAAGDLATELGEAMASHHSTVTLGWSRY